MGIIKTIDENFILESRICKLCQSGVYNLKYEKLMEDEEVNENNCNQDFVLSIQITDECNKISKPEQLNI